jgi:hypothetical protein
MGSGNAVKWGIVVVGFAVAGYLYATSGPEAPATTVSADAAPLDLSCTGCGHHFTLGIEEMRRQVASTPQPTSDGGGPAFRHSSRRPDVVPCPECLENAAVLGTACPEHGTYFPSKNLEGRRGICPECE